MWAIFCLTASCEDSFLFDVEIRKHRGNEIAALRLREHL
jgi:hypothetical protein